MTVDSTDAPHVSDALSPHRVVMISALAPGRLPAVVETARHPLVSQYSGSSPWSFLNLQLLGEPPALPVLDSPGDSIP